METLRLVLLGSGGVGKSCITIRFVQDSFVTEYDPTIEDSYRRQVEVDGQQVMLEILDTAGTEQFTAMRDLYMTSGDGFILVYSIIARSTYNDLPDLRRQILQVKDRDEVPMVLVGNKCDAEDQRQVSRDEAQRLVDKWGSSVSFFETSAKQALRVGDVFNDLTRRLIEARRSGKDGKKKKRNSRDSGASSRCTLF